MIGPALPALQREIARRARLMAAKTWILTHPRAAARLRDEKAWLFGAAVGQAYCDNSAALFEFVRRHRPDINVYWVIDQESRDLARAQSVGPTLDHKSVNTYVKALLASVHVFSHGLHDIPACAHRKCNALRVRLGHGITATRVRRTSTTPRPEASMFGLVPVSSEFEKRNKMSWGILEEQIVVTGLARFDKLLAKRSRTAANPRNLLYMPTWRDGTVKSWKAFSRSEYSRGLLAFIGSRSTYELLNRFDATLKVVFHPIAKRYAQRLVKDLGNDRIVISDPDDLQESIIECGVLITDYSSVCWDALYLDTPVMFYQFDRPSFEAIGGSHIQEEGWPGIVVTDPGQLVAALESHLTGKSVPVGLDERIEQWKSRAFAFRDDNNCARIFNVIERELSVRRLSS